MALTVVTAPTNEPVTVSELKRHLKVDLTDDDSLILTLGQAAREYLEAATRRTLLTTTYDLKLDEFPCDDAIVLPKGPVTSVTSVTYVDTSGTTQMWTAGTTGYLTDLPSGPTAEPARVFPAYGVVYPATRGQVNAVTVRYVAGYGTAGSDVPALLIAALKHLVEHWYANRGVIDSGINAVTSRVPLSVDAMIGAFKVSWT